MSETELLSEYAECYSTPFTVVSKHLPGMHDQRTHARHRLAGALRPDVPTFIETRLKERGGLTAHRFTGFEPTEGYSVALDPAMSLEILPDEPEDQVRDEIIDWVNRHTRKRGPSFDDKKVYIGGWLDQETGHVWMDVVSVWPPDQLEQAKRAAAAANQIALYDLKNGVEVPTGGSGAVAKGARQRFIAPIDVDPFEFADWIMALRSGEVTKFDPNQPRIPKGMPGGGRWGGWLLHVSSMMSDLPERQQRDIIDIAASHGWHRQEMKARLRTAIEAAKTTPVKYDPNVSVYDWGTGWYFHAQEEASNLRDSFGITLEQASGMIAVLSSNNIWETKDKNHFPNLDVTVALLQALDQDVEVTITEADASYMAGEQGAMNFTDAAHWKAQQRKPAKYAGHGTVEDPMQWVGTHRMSDLPPRVAAMKFTQQFGWGYGGRGHRKAGAGLNTGWGNVEKAINIYRDPNSIDAQVVGNKIRSFANSIYAGDGNAVVIDRWMVGVMTGNVGDSTATNADFKIMSGEDPAKVKGEKGKQKEQRAAVADYVRDVALYPLFADIVREVAGELGLEPSDAQAVAWYMGQEIRSQKLSTLDHIGGVQKADIGRFKLGG